MKRSAPWGGRGVATSDTDEQMRDKSSAFINNYEAQCTRLRELFGEKGCELERGAFSAPRPRIWAVAPSCPTLIAEDLKDL